MTMVVNREEELKVLEAVLKNPVAQFIALYGRRRIGKTHLIQNYFGDKGVYLEITGLKKGGMRKQLNVFARAFSKCFYDGMSMTSPKDWQEAFDLVTQKIEEHHKNQPVIIFLDELPWLATKRSGLLETLDHVWNTRWKNFKNLKLIVCGSAAAWMLEKVINDKGGLHNRLTRKMLLKPFTLKQTAEFLKSKKMKLSNKNVLDYYMVTGGVPYYLEFLKKSLSFAQNIHQLCFASDAPLQKEFDQIFKSLFDHSEAHIKIIKTISKKRYGMARDEIVELSGITSGGHLNKRLNELEAAGFVQGYIPLGKKKKDKYYRVIDEYSLFYLRWIEPHLESGFEFPQNYWHSVTSTPEWHSWAGYSFEGVCMKHFQKIITALNLHNITAMPSTWRYSPKKGSADRGAQIDLLLDK